MCLNYNKSKVKRQETSKTLCFPFQTFSSPNSNKSEKEKKLDKSCLITGYGVLWERKKKIINRVGIPHAIIWGNAKSNMLVSKIYSSTLRQWLCPGESHGNFLILPFFNYLPTKAAILFIHSPIFGRLHYPRNYPSLSLLQFLTPQLMMMSPWKYQLTGKDSSVNASPVIWRLSVRQWKHGSRGRRGPHIPLSFKCQFA